MDIFRSYSVTHKGAKHEGDERCQDASIHLPFKSVEIIAVADGHGSSRCFRSDIGSKAAIDAAENTIKSFLENLSEAVADPEGFKTELHRIVKQVINRWFIAVMRDEEANPLQSDPRLEGITEKYKVRYIDDADYRCHAYGTTLMVAAMSESYWFGFQVGDGKCVVLYEDGEWKMPIPWDDGCSFNITTSICDDDSLSRFRYWFGLKESDGSFTEYGYGVEGQGRGYPTHLKSAPRPLAIFIASDGVEDSYPTVDNDKYVINFYRNRVVGLVENGFDAFKKEVYDFAKRFADRESKDDVSIASILGDFGNKSDMITRMKQESEMHEASELAADKRRDADEKKDTLDSVQKRYDSVTSNQRQLESRIATIDNEVTALNGKKASLESSLAKGKSEVEASDRSIMDFQSIIKELERDRSARLHEEQIISAKITIADDEERKAKKASARAESEYIKKRESLLKKQEAYDKHLRKLPSDNPQVPFIGQVQKLTGTQTTITAVTYDANGNVVNRAVAQIPPVNPSFVAHTAANTVVSDAKIEVLKQEIERINAELQAVQAQVVAARQSTETKSRELSALRLLFFEAQQRTQQIESEINRAAQSLRVAEAQNRNQREAVRQLRSEAAETEQKCRAKHAEIDRLNGELETLKEQNKKQTDTLNVIKVAWERAEAEAREAEATIHNDCHQSGEK